MKIRLDILKEIEENIILETYTLKQALEKLDKVSVKVLFIVKNKMLKATLTDGDVRRSILNGASLETSVVDIANHCPIFVESDDRNYIRRTFEEKKIDAIPLLDKNREIKAIYINSLRYQKKESGEIDVPVAIMAGGLGTRLYPYTKILPKPLIPIVDTPISERIIQSFQKVGCKEFYMIINYKRNMIKAYFADLDKNYNIQFIEETIPLGTGGGVRLLKDWIHSTFILTNCDILILDNVKKMIDHHKNQKNQVTMVCSLKNFEIPYGVVNFSGGGEISSFEEKPKMSFFTNTGYYILEPDIFKYIGENENIGMPDIITRMKEDGQKVGIYPISENAWLDMGQMDSMESMERKVKELDIV